MFAWKLSVSPPPGAVLSRLLLLLLALVCDTFEWKLSIPPTGALPSAWLLLLPTEVCDMFARKLSMAPPSGACRPCCCCFSSHGGVDLHCQERDEVFQSPAEMRRRDLFATRKPYDLSLVQGDVEITLKMIA